MPKRALIDTNVLLDAAMAERPAHVPALLLLDEVAYGELILYVSVLSLKDVYYVLSKYAGEPQAREYITNAMDAMELVPVDLGTCRAAALSSEPDFEDGLIRACAEREKVDYIISRDATAFQHSTIKRISAQEYVDMFCSLEEVELSATM